MKHKVIPEVAAKVAEIENELKMQRTAKNPLKSMTSMRLESMKSAYELLLESIPIHEAKLAKMEADMEFRKNHADERWEAERKALMDRKPCTGVIRKRVRVQTDDTCVVCGIKSSNMDNRMVKLCDVHVAHEFCTKKFKV